jgi:hypothetical protein
MRFWGITALRYIKSEEITPVELMTANEWGRQPAHSAISGRREDFPQPAVRCGTDGLRAGVVNPPGLTCAALPLTSEGRQRIKR